MYLNSNDIRSISYFFIGYLLASCAQTDGT